MSDRTTPSTSQRRRQRTQAIILQAAEELLAEGGLQNATLANIAHRSAYSKPAIYKYFNGIEDLLSELANSGFIRLGKVLKTIPAHLPMEERMRAAFHAFLEFASQNAELYQLMFTHIIYTNNRQDWVRQSEPNETQAAYYALVEIIQDGIDQGIFKVRPGFDKGAMIYMCWITLHGMASLKKPLLQEVGLNVQQYQEEMLQIIFNNLRGIAAGE